MISYIVIFSVKFCLLFSIRRNVPVEKGDPKIMNVEKTMLITPGEKR